MGETVCPRCGFKNSFTKGFLPGTCACKVCLSQLDWREIPGAGPECVPLDEWSPADEPPGQPGGSGESGPEGSPRSPGSTSQGSGAHDTAGGAPDEEPGS